MNIIGRRPGVKFLAALPEGEEISCMAYHAGSLYVASRDTVYTIPTPGLRAWWLRIKKWWTT